MLGAPELGGDAGFWRIVHELQSGGRGEGVDQARAAHGGDAAEQMAAQLRGALTTPRGSGMLPF